MTRSDLTCSGDMYAGEPSTLPGVVSGDSGNRSSRAIPKSMIRGPSGESRMLDGLMSRCTTPARCTWANACATASARDWSRPEDSGPLSATCCWIVGPGTNSLTMYGCRPVRSASRTRAVASSPTRLAAPNSRRTRASATSSYSLPGSRNFTTTRCPVRSRASHTTPCPPRPSSRSQTYPPTDNCIRGSMPPPPAPPPVHGRPPAYRRRFSYGRHSGCSGPGRCFPLRQVSTHHRLRPARTRSRRARGSEIATRLTGPTAT